MLLHRDDRDFLWHSLAPPRQHLERLRLCLLARKGRRRLQEAEEADHTDLGGDHERPVLQEGPPRARDEFLGPGAASRHQPSARGEATIGTANLPGKEEEAREYVLH